MPAYLVHSDNRQR